MAAANGKFHIACEEEEEDDDSHGATNDLKKRVRMDDEDEEEDEDDEEEIRSIFLLGIEMSVNLVVSFQLLSCHLNAPHG